MTETSKMVQEKTGATENKPAAGRGGSIASKDITIEQALDMIDNLDAKEALKSKIRLMRAETEQRIRELDGQGKQRQTEENIHRPADRWTVINGKPMKDPDGEYDTFLQAMKVCELERKEQGKEKGLLEVLLTSGLIGGKSNNDTFQLEMNKLMFGLITAMFTNQGKSPDGAVTQALQRKIESLEKEAAESRDPAAAAARLSSTLDVFRQMGFIPPPRDENISVDKLREDNRHAEEMRKLDAENEFKQSLGRAVESIPVSLGEGIGHAMSGKRDQPRPAQTSPNVQCPKCRTAFYVPAEMTSIKCPQCGVVLDRPAQGQPPAAQEQPVPKPSEDEDEG